MSRRSRAEVREIDGDPKYGSTVLQKFINRVMQNGEKAKAEILVYDAMELIEERSGQPAHDVFEQAISNTRPALEVKSRRVGGATYQVPHEVRPERRTALSIKWLVDFARNRPEKNMAERLAGELLSASRNEGATVRRKDEVHRMAEANKAFAHYRW